MLVKSLLLLILLIQIFITVPLIHAQACDPGTRNQGLVSGTSLLGNFGNPTGQCVIDPKAAYVEFKVPNYNELKSVYFTQNKSMTQFTLPNASYPCAGGMSSGSIYLRNLHPNLANFNTKASAVNVSCSLTRIDHTSGANGPFSTGNQMVVVFAEGNVSIDSNLTYGGESYGLVIVAKGDIYIAPTVTRVDAILVSEGNIFTSAAANTQNFGQTSDAPQLVVNGSIISLGQGAQRIYFNRSLTDNTSTPAELVNYQPKYLVLLRGLLAQSYSIQREIGPEEIPTSSLFPSPTGYPSPATDSGCGNNPVWIRDLLSISTNCAIP